MASILLVDDDAFTRQTIGRLLERSGHQVVQAVSGHAALDLLRGKQHRVDLVLTDIMMPDIDGLELVREIRAAWPGLPIVAMTAGGAVVKINYLPVAKLFGARQVLVKPCSREALDTAIAESLGTVGAPAPGTAVPRSSAEIR